MLRSFGSEPAPPVAPPWPTDQIHGGLPSGTGSIDGMTVVKINALTVPADSGDELARRFAARAGAVDSQDGFEGFELLRPTDGRTTWLVITRWRDDESFVAWQNSAAFGQGHRSAGGGQGEQARPPVAVSSELWSYDIAGGSGG
jgi:heme oxygenase (mycobilin-producing)